MMNNSNDSNSITELLGNFQEIDGNEPVFLKKLVAGSTSSEIFFVQCADKLYAVKTTDYSSERVPLLQQASNSTVLRKRLPHRTSKICLVRSTGERSAMITDTIGMSNYADRAFDTDPKTYEIWKEITSELTALWKTSKVKRVDSISASRNFGQRYERIHTGFLEASIQGYKINSIYDLPVAINGEIYPSLRETLLKLKSIKKPNFYVTCHGDPQPTNVIVDTNSNNWQFIDWEWTGSHHDWRMMTAHLYGWWETNRTCIVAPSKITTRDSLLEITFSSEPDDQVRRYQQKVFEDIISFCDNKLSNADCESINDYIALLLLGEVRFRTSHFFDKFGPLIIGRAVQYAHTDLFCKENRRAMEHRQQ